MTSEQLKRGSQDMALSFIRSEEKVQSSGIFFLNYIFPDPIRSLEDNVPLSVLLDGFNLFSMHRAVITEAHCMLGLMINVNPVMYINLKVFFLYYSPTTSRQKCENS